MFPSHYKINILPEQLKQDLCTKYQEHLTTLSEENQSIIGPLYQSIYYYVNLETTTQDIESFYHRTIELDAKRKEEITTIIPEYRNWFTELEKKYGRI